MRCALCMLEGTKVSYQDVAVVGGYSLCESHLKEWAFSDYPSVAEWMIERKAAFVTAWDEAEIKADHEERESIKAAVESGELVFDDVVSISPPRCDAVHLGTGEQCVREEHSDEKHKYGSDVIEEKIWEGDEEWLDEHKVDEPQVTMFDAVKAGGFMKETGEEQELIVDNLESVGTETPKTTGRYKKGGTFYCTKCDKRHGRKSGIGKKHKEFMGVKE